MTYIVNTRRRMAVPFSLAPGSKPLSMGGIGDIFSSLFPSTTPMVDGLDKAMRATFQDSANNCIAEANGTAIVAGLDAKIQNLAAAWNPTGVFMPADVNTLVSAVVQQLMGAKAVVLVAPASVSDQLEVRMQAVDDIDKQYADGARFSQAATAALASGGVVNAPDLKDYVLRSLLAASNGYVTAAVLTCNVSWLQSVSDALDSVGALALKILGIIATAVETIVDVADSTLSTADFLAKYSGPIVIGVGALAVWWMFFKK